MEYIREMLRRQRTALGRLMLGGGSAEEPEAAAASPATERTSPAAPAPWETDGTASGTGGWEIRGNSFAGAGADRQTGPTSAGETLRLALARKRAERQYTAAFGPAGTGETADSAGRLAVCLMEAGQQCPAEAKRRRRSIFCRDAGTPARQE